MTFVLKYLFFFILICSFAGEPDVTASLPAEQETQVLEREKTGNPNIFCYDFAYRAMSAEARYRAGSGIGYNRGYTTLEIFLSPSRSYSEWIPFCDLRGHVFNNGKLAANAGLGVRCVAPISVGVNAYYDYRKTRHYHYNQVGAGIEAMGSFWGANCNVYVPVGKKRSSFYDFQLDGSGLSSSFAFFSGNQLFLNLSGSLALTGKKEFAFKGFDLNAFFLLMKHDFFLLDFSIGPYLYTGSFGKTAGGAQAKVTARLSGYFSTSASGSYDNVFHARGQGEFALTIPFGPKNFKKERSKGLCNIPTYLDLQLARGPQRNEIVVLDKERGAIVSQTFSGTPVAVNPATGLPFIFWFVDNTSTSNGTYESPFSTLADAAAAAGPNDIIYVFPGDGTSMGMNSGITLQENQKLVGAADPFSLSTADGTVTIPAQATTRPLLENAGNIVVALESGNILSGLHLSNCTMGVNGNGVEGLTIQNCQIDSTSLAIGLNTFRGSATIQDNTLSATDGTSQICAFDSADGGTFLFSGNTCSNYISRAIGLSLADSAKNVTIANNTFVPGAGGSEAALIQITGASTADFVYSGNTSMNHQTIDLSLFVSDSSIVNSTIANNTATGIAGTSQKGLNITSNNSSQLTITVDGNTCSGYTQADIYLDSRHTSNLSATVTNNTTMGSVGFTSPFGIQLDADETSSTTATVDGNRSENHTSVEIILSSRGTMTSINATVSNNTVISPAAVMNTIGIQASASNDSSLACSITNNTCQSQQGAGINVFGSNNSTLSSMTLSNNTITAPTTLLSGTATGINATTSGTSSISSILISGNQCDEHTSAINLNASGNSHIPNFTISNNQIAIRALTNTQGIAVGADTTSSYGATLGLIENNTCSQIEQNGIILTSSTTQDVFATVKNNNASIGSAGAGIGILTVPFNTGMIHSVIEENSITGQAGSLIGIAVTNQGTGCQSGVIVRNNTVQNVNATMPPFPIPNFGGGLGSAILGSGDLYPIFENNALINNLPQGAFISSGGSFGGTGVICLTLTDNESDTGYRFYNPTDPAANFIYDVSGNTGTIIFDPGMGSFTSGTCTGCP